MTRRTTSRAIARNIRAAELAGLAVRAIAPDGTVITGMVESLQPQIPLSQAAKDEAECDRVFGLAS